MKPWYVNSYCRLLEETVDLLVVYWEKKKKKNIALSFIFYFTYISLPNCFNLATPSFPMPVNNLITCVISPTLISA